MERLRVIDWANPLAGNDFLLVSQMTITGSLYTCRPDLVGFVNGLPLVVVELKKPGFRPSRRSTATSRATSTRRTASRAVLVQRPAHCLNGIESRVGTLTADWERFFE